MTNETTSFRLDSDFAPSGGDPGVITLTLRNLGDRPVTDFRLALNSLFRIKEGSEIQGGRLLEQVSNYHVLAPPDGFVLKPGASWSISTDRLSHRLTHYNYGPKSAYLILAGGGLAPVAVTAMTRAGEKGAPLFDPKPGPALPADSAPLALLPFPAEAKAEGSRDVSRPLSLGDADGEARAAFEAVSNLAGRLFPGEQPLFAASVGIVCAARKEAMPEEAYRIGFAADGVTVSASGRAGFLYAFITLGQLLRGARTSSGTFTLPAGGEISDRPRFAWRGMMLDGARQTFGVDKVLKLIDCLAWLKVNRFHFHLTDDEAWRIDVPGYPQVAATAAWRGHGLVLPPLLGSSPSRHGLVYSRVELASLVRRAEELGITVVPEVDIPGHNYCVLEAIPSLKDPDETGTYRSIQYFPNNALNPALPETYKFLEAVYGELAAIFPSPWLHVGGDEVSEGAWLGSPLALALMKERGWVDIHQLQSFFLQRVQKMIAGLGRGAGAWEEAALGGGIDPKGSVLFAWRKSASGLALAKDGYDVVLCPAEAYYLDMAQSDDWWEPGASWAGTVTPEASYAYEPGGDWPDEIKPRLLGVQANLWTENLHDSRLFDHMIFPRMSAVAETGWTLEGRKSFARFAAVEGLIPRTGG